MRRWQGIINFVAVFLLSWVVLAVGNVEGRNQPPQIVNGKYIILLKAQEGIPSGFNAAISEAGGQVVRTMPEIGVVVASSEKDDFVNKLARNNDVLRIIPDIKVQWIPDEAKIQTITPLDEPLYGYQWSMQVIDAPKAWQAGYTGKGARVAVVDTGITPDHPDLTPNIDFVASTSFVPLEPWINDEYGHGTHVAGIIAAVDNNFGVIGVAPEATLISVKVISSSGWGDFSWIIDGIRYAASDEVKADIINMSLGDYFPKNGHVPDDWPWPPYAAGEAAYYLSVMSRTLSYACRQGVTIICAAGNDAVNLNHDREWVVLPASASNCLAVSATGPLSQKDFDTPAVYTNFGTSVIDVAAPGGNIDFSLYPSTPGWWFDMVFSTYIGGWAWMAGTSMAAPHVSGVAALIISQHGGEIAPAQVKAIIEQSADDLGKQGMDDYYGHGRINAFKAVCGSVK